ncbi:MAG: GGDEF domain-containing protein [Sulfurimonas sp.]|nr:GGDEF domain-containing protein [Sulfurimonas sp.]
MFNSLEKLNKDELIALVQNQKSEHEFMQNVIDSMSDTIMVVKLDYSVPFMDKSVQEKMQTVRILDENSPKCYEIYHNRDIPCDGIDHPCPLQNTLDTHEETTVLHKEVEVDGSATYLELVATPIFDKDKNMLGIVESTRDITQHRYLLDQLEEKSELLQYQATHDNLTGLPNRALFMDRLEEGIKEAKRNKKSLALLFLDLDDFKIINDTYGHKYGDKVLQGIAKGLSSQLRETDTLSRLGGDEFTIIMKDIKSIDDVIVLSKKLLGCISSFPFEIENNIINISCSIGISLYDYQDNEEADKLISDADNAMYTAKKLGKNRVSVNL